MNPAPVNPTPVNPAPVNPTPVNPTPVNPTPVNPTPVNPTPVNPAPVNPTPVGPTPVSPAPVGPTPVSPTPVGPTPVSPTPVSPTPVSPTPVSPTPVSPTPVSPTPVNPTPVNPASMNPEPTNNMPEEQAIDPAYLKKPVKVTEKKKRKIPLIITIILLILVGCVVTYFILYSPKKIFQNVITKGETKITDYISDADIDKYLNETKINFNTDNKDLEELKKYTYGFKSSMDKTNEQIEEKIYMIDETNKEYSVSGYLKKAKLYLLFSTYNKLIYLNDLKESENTKNITNKEIKYLIKKTATSLKNNLNNNNFSRKLESITVNTKNIKALKNTYKIDKKEDERLKKAIINDLYNDKKACETLVDLTGISKEELKQEIDNYTSNKADEITYINIYTNITGKIIGYNIQPSEKETISYYKNKKDFNITFINEYTSFYINGVTKGKNLNVSIKQNEKEIATLDFDKYTKDEISFNYNIKDINYKGKVTYKNSNKNDETTGLLNIKINDQKNNYEININSKSINNAKIDDINEKEAVKLSDEEMAKVIEDFITSLNETPLGNIFKNTNTLDYTEYEQSV